MYILMAPLSSLANRRTDSSKLGRLLFPQIVGQILNNNNLSLVSPCLTSIDLIIDAEGMGQSAGLARYSNRINTDFNTLSHSIMINIQIETCYPTNKLCSMGMAGPMAAAAAAHSRVKPISRV